MNALTEEQQDRVDIIKHKLKFIEQKPAVACVVNLQPIIFAGNDIVELVGIAGGASVTQLQNVDVIIVMLAGHSIEQMMKEMDKLLQLPAFNEISAVKNNRLYIADPNNQHPVEILEVLAEIINPKQFIFGYEGEKWVKFRV